jgi:hypothetical protein
MLGFKCLIFSFFLWFPFTTSPHSNEAPYTFDCQTEITNSSNDTNNQALIIDSHLELNQANWSLKTFKTPNTHSNNKLKQPNAETYNYKLNYLEIGNSITLKLTSTAIIFPFHSFT